MDVVPHIWFELALEEEEPSYLDFVAYIVAQEVKARDETQRQKQIQAARFPFWRTLNDFDFTFQTSVRRQTLLDLAQLDFVERP